MRALILVMLVFPAMAHAETLVAARTIRSHSLLTAQDITRIPDTIPGALVHPEDVIGQETRVILYAGRPIRPGDVGPPAIIERNQIVNLRYANGALSIVTEARALGRAGVGDTLRVMNLSSRNTVSGVVSAQGDVEVTTPPQQ